MKIEYVVGGVVLVCALAVLITVGLTAENDATGNAVQVQDTQVQDDAATQTVMVSLSREGYTFTPQVVTAGIPVRLVNDGSVAGCAVWMVQSELGIDADFTKSNEYVFVPEKKGTFTVACTMGMFKGNLEVV